MHSLFHDFREKAQTWSNICRFEGNSRGLLTSKKSQAKNIFIIIFWQTLLDIEQKLAIAGLIKKEQNRAI